ncbi:kinase-like protein [Penicillium majusculum]|nr:kinase-like protein [Penicillium majusculum]
MNPSQSSRSYPQQNWIRPANSTWDYDDDDKPPKIAGRYFKYLESFVRILQEEEAKLPELQEKELSSLVKWSQDSGTMWLHMLIPSGFNDTRSFPFTQLRQHIEETEWARREKEFYNSSELEAFAERKVNEFDKYDEALEKLEQTRLLVDSGGMTTQEFVSNALNYEGIKKAERKAAKASLYLPPDHRYIKLTVYVYTAPMTVTQDIEIYNHLRSIQSNHVVHPPLGISLGQLTELLPGGVTSSFMVRILIRNILVSLDFLHAEAGVIHTEFDEPVPRKIFKNRTIYLSRPLPISYGTPVLCDLGSARLGTDHQEGDIMPDIYRAPEVILEMTWDYKVDIWSVGLLIWDLLERRHLFRARNSAGNLDDGFHLAKMQAVLGSPPLKFPRRSERSYEFWDAKGNWKGVAPIPKSNLETLEESLKGDEKEDFLRFLQRMLCWLPEERPSAKELRFDPWLMHGLFK